MNLGISYIIHVLLFSGQGKANQEMNLPFYIMGTKLYIFYILTHQRAWKVNNLNQTLELFDVQKISEKHLLHFSMSEAGKLSWISKTYSYKSDFPSLKFTTGAIVIFLMTLSNLHTIKKIQNWILMMKFTVFLASNLHFHLKKWAKM